MTDTLLSSATKELTIGFGRPFVMIGERINPTGRKLLAEEMKNDEHFEPKPESSDKSFFEKVKDMFS